MSRLPLYLCVSVLHYSRGVCTPHILCSINLNGGNCFPNSVLAGIPKSTAVCLCCPYRLPTDLHSITLSTTLKLLAAGWHVGGLLPCAGGYAQHTFVHPHRPCSLPSIHGI